MNIAGILLFCALAWHQPNKPDGQAGKANAVANAAHYAAFTLVSQYQPQNETNSTKKEPPKWYATSWAPEWALFFVGVGGVWAAISTLRHLRESSERQLRAYVFPEGAGILDGTMLTPPIPARANFPWVGLHIKNTGQTPAYRLRSWFQIAVIAPASENTLVIPTIVPNANFGSILNLGPGGAFSKNLWFDRPLTAPEITDIANNARAIYAYGRIEYEDAFRRTRFTNFRLRYNGAFPPVPNAIFNFSEGGNEAN